MTKKILLRRNLVKKKRLLKLLVPISLVLVLAVALPLTSGCRPAPEVAPPEVAPPKTVNIGAIFALTGEAAAWGLPGLTGMTILIDDINAAGGLQVGDERYLVNLIAYDDEHISSKALMGATKLVLEDDIKLAVSICAPPAEAMAPFLTEHKVIHSPLEAVLVHPDYPYVMTGFDYSFRTDLARNVYCAQAHPEVERAAIISQKDAVGERMNAWCAAGWESMGVDVVYRELFAYETTDFAPIMSAMLATDPDVVDLSATYPGWSDLLIGLAYDQGFDGYITLNNCDLELTLAEAPAEWLDGRLLDSYPELDDPWWGEPSPQHDFYNKWMARYGPGAPEDQFRRMTPCDWLYVAAVQVWAYGVEAAGTFDAEAVVAAAKAAGEIPTLQGPAIFPAAAEEVFGIDNLYEAPLYVCTITSDGERRIVSGVDFWGWYDQYGDILLTELEESGVAWYQK